MLFASVVGFVVSSLAVAVLLYLLKDVFVRKGYYGLDIHKPTKPRVAEMGGIVSSLVILAALALTFLIVPTDARGFLLVFVTVLVYYFSLGLIDDLLDLGSRVKLPASLLGGAVVLFVGRYLDVGFYNPRPYFPLVGEIHGVSILYPVFVPIALAVTSNAYNMYDVYNGTLTFASTAGFLVLGVLVLLAGVARYSALVSYLSFTCAGASFGLYLVNRYPAHFFLGDVGSLSLGALFGIIAITGRLEIVAAVTILPMLMNGFLSFSSRGRIFGRHELKERPVVVSNGYISANTASTAPMSLANILTSKRPLTEKQVINRYHALTLLAILLAVITFVLTPW